MIYSNHRLASPPIHKKMPLPKQPAPPLKLTLLNGNAWNLKDRHPGSFTLIIFYRGYHCPICRTQLRDLDRSISYFRDIGVDVIACSMDNLEHAQKTYSEWELKQLQVGYELSVDSARNWGLYLSKSIKDQEPSIFSEPGWFLIHPDCTIYCAIVQSMPIARPKAKQILTAIKFILEKNYPARGEVE